MSNVENNVNNRTISLAHLDDFDEEESYVTTSTTAPANTLSTTTHSETLVHDQWGPFCFDMALSSDDWQVVCETYKITESCFERLLDNPAFVNRLKDARMQVKTLGPNAGFVLFARVEAEKHLLTLSNIAGQQGVGELTRVRAIENLVRYAHMDPSVQKGSAKDDNRATSPGVLVQFNIGGGLLGKNTQVIDVNPEPAGNDE